MLIKSFLSLIQYEFHGSKQPHEINIWKNSVSKSKLEISNEIVLELQPLINNEYLPTIISNNKY